MNINPENWLETEPGDPWQLDRKESPNTKPGLQPQKILIATTLRARMEDAVRAYQVPNASSYHFVLGKNGRDLVQLVPLDKQSRCTRGYEPDAISIALDYNPSMVVDTQPYVTVVAGNNRHVRHPTFPDEQLDALLDLLAILVNQTGVDAVMAIREIYEPGGMPGPAFPLTQLQELLFSRTQGGTQGRMALDEITAPAILRREANMAAPPVTAEPLPTGTHVFCLQDWHDKNNDLDWVRVEVVHPTEERPWQVGWVEAAKAQAINYQLEVRHHRLFTIDGRVTRFMPAASVNYDSKNIMENDAVHYIIMHTTTGLQIQNTINTFQNPEEKEKVSAHLVIGRDGRLVQMVPFNHAAYHAGSGLWENQDRINWNSIGIEVDNGGRLRDGSGRVYHPDKEWTIPEGQYERIKHWREYHVKPWHNFPQIQKDVTFQAVRAIMQHFPSIQDILEHERVSLAIRTDPGPLFPMDDLRQEHFGRSEPDFEHYRLIREATLFQNSYYKAPKAEYPKYPPPKSTCQVEIVFDKSNYWYKIEIIKYPANKKWQGRQGWVRKRGDIFREDGKSFLNPKRDFYQDPGDKLEPPCLPLKTLPKGTVVRVQKHGKNNWRLVATPEHKEGFKFEEGWLHRDDLELI